MLQNEYCVFMIILRRLLALSVGLNSNPSQPLQTYEKPNLRTLMKKGIRCHLNVKNILAHSKKRTDIHRGAY